MTTIPYFQAIYTKYCGPTNTRGSRIIVTIQRGNDTVKKTFSYSYAAHNPHTEAAQQALSEVLGSEWTIQSCGESPDGKGYVYLAAHESYLK